MYTTYKWYKGPIHVDNEMVDVINQITINPADVSNEQVYNSVITFEENDYLEFESISRQEIGQVAGNYLSTWIGAQTEWHRSNEDYVVWQRIYDDYTMGLIQLDVFHA